MAERCVLIKTLCFSGPHGRTRAPQVASACVLRTAVAPAGNEHQEHVGQAAKRLETHSALLNEGLEGVEAPVFFLHRGTFQRFNWRRNTRMAADNGGIQRAPFAAIRFSRANSCPQQHL